MELTGRSTISQFFLHQTNDPKLNEDIKALEKYYEAAKYYFFMAEIDAMVWN